MCRVGRYQDNLDCLFHNSLNKAFNSPHTGTGQCSHDKQQYIQILNISPVNYCQFVFIWHLHIQIFNVWHVYTKIFWIWKSLKVFFSYLLILHLTSLHISFCLSSWSSSCPLLFISFVIPPSSQSCTPINYFAKLFPMLLFCVFLLCL